MKALYRRACAHLFPAIAPADTPRLFSACSANGIQAPAPAPFIRKFHWNPMEDTDLQALIARLELLIKRVEQLKSQNGLLLAQEKSWREERAHLIEKNEIARHKVESMISRLKALEQDS
jgi:cell division protein ZapB